MADKPRLGKGLNALLGGAGDGASVPGEARVLPIEQIHQNPYQPRKAFDTEELAGLCESIKAHGLLQPLVVRRVGDQFQLVAGERRLRAAKEAGKSDVPVVLVEFNDQEVVEAALAENLQRADLNPIEKAQAFKEYLDKYGVTQDDLAAKLGLDRTTISNLVGLLDLAAEVQDAVRVKQITLGHAKVLKGVKDQARQVSLLKEIVAQGLSVRGTEALLKQPEADRSGGRSTAEPAAPVEKTAHVQGIEDDLRQKLATRVEIKLKDREKGQIIIGFETNDDFQRVVDALRK